MKLSINRNRKVEKIIQVFTLGDAAIGYSFVVNRPIIACKESITSFEDEYVETVTVLHWLFLHYAVLNH